jgi:tRNA(fMet)-specific endonuclease VapC
MKRTLLDTDILSEVLKNRNASVSEAAMRYRTAFGRLTLSSITVMEIVKGFHKTGQTGRLNLFLENLSLEEVLVFDIPAAELGGRIFADLERNGQPIGRADPMIAAIAINHGFVLATANIEHFKRIQALGYALELTNWRDDVPSSKL